MRNLLRPHQFPYVCATGWEYDSGDYPAALRLALDMAGYDELRAEQAQPGPSTRAPGEEAVGIGMSFFTEAVGAGRASTWTSSGSAWPTAPSCASTRPAAPCWPCPCRPRGRATRRRSRRSSSHELGIGTDEVEVVHGDTDRTPFGLGTYGSRSTPVSGAAAVVVARKVRERARLVASAMLEVDPDDLEWTPGRWPVRGVPGVRRDAAPRSPWRRTRTSSCRTASSGHLDASCVYNPPNLTFPYGAYVCVVDVDPGTGQVRVRRFVAVDDCGVRINPTIVEGQVHGGLADGIGMALMELIAFDEDGNHLGASFMDYLLPTAMECPSWELGETVTPSPHHPIGAKGVGESATVGSPAAVVNAVLDAIGVRHADMPLTPAQVWCAIQGRPIRPDLAVR